MSKNCEEKNCRNPGGGTQCVACHKISCMEHSPTPGKFCNDCELLFFTKRDSSQNYKVARAGGFLIPWIVFALLAYPVLKNVGFMASGTSVRGFSTGIPLLDMAIFAGIFSAMMCGGFGSIASSGIRKEMIRQNN